MMAWLAWMAGKPVLGHFRAYGTCYNYREALSRDWLAGGRQ